MDSFRMAPDWERQLLPHTEKMLQDIAGQIEEDARALVPVDTGDLKASIFSEVNGDQARIGATADYAAFVELGTSDTPAQEYLRPALFRNRKSS